NKIDKICKDFIEFQIKYEKNLDLHLGNRLHADTYSLHDTLGFEDYKKALRDFILDEGTKGPFVIAINGPWGSGKTSFMRQLQRDLEEKDAQRDLKEKDAITVWFDAWKHNSKESVWAALALEVESEIYKGLGLCP
ncbi:P-loop NTPase fold protein, partial [Ardenticatena maritima]